MECVWGAITSRQSLLLCHPNPNAKPDQGGCSSPLLCFASRASPFLLHFLLASLPPPLCSTSTGPVPRPCPSVHSCLHNSPGAMALFPFPCFSLDLSFPLEFADSTCSHRTMWAMSPPLLLGDFYQTVAWKGGASPWKKRLYLENFNRTSKGWTFSVQDNGP